MQKVCKKYASIKLVESNELMHWHSTTKYLNSNLVQIHTTY